MSTTFTHAERILGGRTFRLLTILPALDEDEPLQCECRCFDIHDAPPYEALSYAWGNPNPPEELSCNGQSIYVGPSLSHALRRLRHAQTARIIWVDAICIDQNDEAEKSHQVPMMGSIYSSARRVIVWLGQGDAQQTYRAFGASQFIAKACYRYAQVHGMDVDEFSMYEEFDLDLPELTADSLILNSLKELYNRPWFSRIWCIQEIHLATDALVIWGDDEITWSNLGMSALWIYGKQKSTKKSYLALEDIEVRTAVMMSDKTTFPLLVALDKFRNSESSDPRDRVYGLANIVSPRSEVEALGIDYGKNVDEVFADTVLSIIQVYSRLTAFAFIEHEVDYEGPSPDEYGRLGDDKGEIVYRSWAPQWDIPTLPRTLGVPERSFTWSACGEHAQTITVGNCSAPQLLCLKGVAYSKVSEVEEVMDYGNLSDPEYVGKPACRDDPAAAEQSSPDAEDIHFKGVPTKRHPFIKAFERTDVNSSPERFVRTLTAGNWHRTNESIKLTNESMQAKHRNACSRYLSRLLHLQNFGNEGDYAHNRDSARFRSESRYFCRKRRLFWTERGSYGLGPQCMRTGDIVVVLYGGNTPYVLRPRGNKHVFMGQAYVDEIMNGELFQGSTSDTPEEQTFCLI